MCDYSLHAIASEQAKQGQDIITTSFPRTTTRGFASPDNRNVAVCMLPGTELAFDHDIRVTRALFFTRNMGSRTAIFRQLEIHDSHRDALELPDGRIVMVTDLVPDQRGRVLQLAMKPGERRPSVSAQATVSQRSPARI